MTKNIKQLFDENDNFMLRKVYYDFNNVFSKDNLFLIKQLKYDNDFLKLIDMMLDLDDFYEISKLKSLKKLQNFLLWQYNIAINRMPSITYAAEFIEYRTKYPEEYKLYKKEIPNFDLDLCSKLYDKLETMIEDKYYDLGYVFVDPEEKEENNVRKNLKLIVNNDKNNTK